MATVKHRIYVSVTYPVPLIFAHILEKSDNRYSGIVDKHINLTETLKAHVKHFLYITVISHIAYKCFTDTAFFHEIEAYAGNLEVIQNNWEKLSFEWDEACDVFTDYIQSLGLKDHATDGQGNQITFKKWGEQLHEAFDALETYDPDKARSILNELLQYQIDADITQNLQNIVANIDEVLKA